MEVFGYNVGAVDLGIAIILIINAIVGYRNGLTKEILKLILLGVSILITYVITAPKLMGIVNMIEQMTGKDLDFKLVFTVAFTVFSGINLVMATVLYSLLPILSNLLRANRILRAFGVAIGSLRVFVIAGAWLFLFTNIVKKDTQAYEAVNKSKMAEYAIKVYDVVYDKTTKEIRNNEIDNQLKRLMNIK